MANIGGKLDIVVLRPPLVYGPGVRANFLRLIRLVERRWPLPLGAVKNRRSLIYVGNLAELVVAAASSPIAAGQTFLAADGDDLSTPQLISEIGRALGTNARLIGVPVALLRLGGALTSLMPRGLANASGGGHRSLPGTASPRRCAGTARRPARNQRLARMRAMQGVAGAVSFVLAFIAVRLLLTRFARFALDRPNERSLHEHPVPRTGGIAVLVGIAAAAPFGSVELWLALGLAFALAAISFVDDLKGLPAAARLGAHLLAAGVLVWYLLSPIYLWQAALLVLGIAWLTNLYNFMDGSDGLAGGMTVIGFAAYAGAAALAEEPELATICLCVAAAAAAFLVFNFHPARIFLGDVGSIPLGFLAGALGIIGWNDEAWPLWFPCAVFAPFIADATLTLVRRLIRAERVWQAHREHYYQRMVRSGLGHRGTAYIAYGIMALCAGAALLGLPPS